MELINNYRSHPKILEFPSKEFYNGKLEAKAPELIVNQLLGWSKLQNPNFPILFCATRGKDEREGDSPSFFNRNEAMNISKLVSHLIEEKEIDPEDIAVISPYY